MTESLGFQTQAVGELVAKNSTTTAVGGGILHIMLFGGQNCGMLVEGDNAGSFPNKVTSGTEFASTIGAQLAVGFAGSNGIDFSGSTTVTSFDQYAYWRLVSQGCILNLLNPAEENDGWFEAVRLTEPLNPSDWGAQHVDAQNSLANVAIVPQQMLQNLRQLNIVNENSYTTGVLRDIGTRVFKLHGITDEHDVKRQQQTHELEGGDYPSGRSSLEGIGRPFAVGRDGPVRLIKQYIDQSFDMIYIRIHGRAAGNPTRIHYNLVSNQEIAFDSSERESRFHTTGARVQNFDEHHSAARANQSAAHVIPM